MIKNNPRFSVIVPIYNVEKFLRQCIESVMRQTYQNFELILVDDGATDSSGKICDEYASQSDKIQVIHKNNGGLVSARRTGVLAANGKYIAYVDGDDWVADCWLLEVSRIIDKHHPDIVEFNAYKNIDGKNIELKTSHYRGFFDKNEVAERIIPSMLFDRQQRFFTFGILPAVWSKIIRTDILKENLCTEDRISFGEDVACIYNSILICESFYGIEKSLYYYRQNNQSMTKAYDAKRFDRLEILFEYLKKNLLPKNITLEKQYDAYVLFCILYAALNEAKSDADFSDMAVNFEQGLKNIGMKGFVEQTTIGIGIPWSIMLYLMKKEKYKALCVLCRLIVKVKYSYKS